MNQKLVKAKKRIAEGRARSGDAERIARTYAYQSNSPKPLQCRVQKAKDPIKPTWPNSIDQRKQSRPIIIQRPLRHIHERHPDMKDAQGNFAGYAWRYAEAMNAAKEGDGASVRRLAHSA